MSSSIIEYEKTFFERIENIKSDAELSNYDYSEGILHINILGPAALEFQHFNVETC